MEILFVVLFAYLRKTRSESLQRAAKAAASKGKEVLAVDQIKQALPNLIK
jgi:hypothetical protein